MKAKLILRHDPLKHHIRVFFPLFLCHLANGGKDFLQLRVVFGVRRIEQQACGKRFFLPRLERFGRPQDGERKAHIVKHQFDCHLQIS